MLHLHQLLNKSILSGSTTTKKEAEDAEQQTNSASIILPQTLCKRCGIEFEDIRSLRDHFKAQHNHGNNTNISEKSIEDNESSSENDEDEMDNEEEIIDNDTTMNVDIYNNDQDDYENISVSNQPYAYDVRPPFIPVVFRNLSEEYVYSVYRILLTNYFQTLDDQSIYWRHPSFVVHLPSVTPYLISPGECWLVMLYRGGYFSGVIAEMASSLDTLSTSSSGKNVTTNQIKILCHKRFARYTTRRKQGGSQSAHDASAGKAANSMGAQLRRYNEQILIQDIQNLLQTNEWATLVKNKVSRIFISAAKTMTGHLFDGKTLCRGDKRIYRIPFATSRPTFEEAIRVVETLSKVRIVTKYTSNEEEEKQAIYNSINKESKEIEKLSEKLGTTNITARVTDTANDNEEDEEEEDSDEATTTTTNDQQKKKKKKKHNRTKGKGKQTSTTNNNDISTANTSKAKTKANVSSSHKTKDNNDMNDEDDELLNSAIATANIEAKNVQVAFEQQMILSNVVQETIQEIRIISKRLQLPPNILARVLALPNLESEFEKKSTNFNFVLYSGSNLGPQIEAAREKLILISKLISESNLSNHDILLTMGWDSLAAAVVVVEAGLQVDWSQVQIPIGKFDHDNNNTSSSSSKPNKGKKNKQQKDNESIEDRQVKLLTIQQHPSIVPLQKNSVSSTNNNSSSSSSSTTTTTTTTTTTSTTASSHLPVAPIRVNAGDEAAMNSISDKERKRTLMRMAAEQRALQQQQQQTKEE